VYLLHRRNLWILVFAAATVRPESRKLVEPISSISVRTFRSVKERTLKCWGLASVKDAIYDIFVLQLSEVLISIELHQIVLYLICKQSNSQWQDNFYLSRRGIRIRQIQIWMPLATSAYKYEGKETCYKKPDWIRHGSVLCQKRLGDSNWCKYKIRSTMRVVLVTWLSRSFLPIEGKPFTLILSPVRIS